MKKIYLCGTGWCSPCQFVKNHIMNKIEQECAGQTEYIDLQKNTEYIDRFKVYRIPMMCLTEDDKLILRFSGSYPSTEVLIGWLKGECNDIDTEFCRPC